MGTELDEDRVIADYANGRPVEEIQAVYGLTRDEVEYLVAANTKPLSGWSLQRKGNRVTLAVLVGWLAWFVANTAGAPGYLPLVFGLLVAGLGYVLLALWINVAAGPRRT